MGQNWRLQKALSKYSGSDEVKFTFGIFFSFSFHAYWKSANELFKGHLTGELVREWVKKWILQKTLSIYYASHQTMLSFGPFFHCVAHWVKECQSIIKVPFDGAITSWIAKLKISKIVVEYSASHQVKVTFEIFLQCLAVLYNRMALL